MAKKKENTEVPLYIISGNDTHTITAHISEYEKKYLKEGYERTVRTITSVEEIESLEAEIFGIDLFVPHKIFILIGSLEYDGMQSILERLIAYDTYPHILVFREVKISTEIKKFLTKYGYAPETYDLPEIPPPSVFRLCDAWGSNDVKATWLVYHELLDAGIPVHQMIGMLWWQISTVLLVMRSPSNPGLKPFVYSKAQKILTKYSPEKLWEQAHGLIAVYHKGHNGSDIEILFERFLLGEVV